jgi:hypothetical protein
MLDETEKSKFFEDLEKDPEFKKTFLDIENITLSLRKEEQLELYRQIFNKSALTAKDKSVFNNFLSGFNKKLAAQIATAILVFCVAATTLNSIINRPFDEAPPTSEIAPEAAPKTADARISADSANRAFRESSESAKTADNALADDADLTAKSLSDSNLYIRKLTINLDVENLEEALSALNELGGESLNADYYLTGKNRSAYVSEKVNLNYYWNYIERLKALGETTSFDETAELATARILDPEAKIAARRAQYARLNDILSRITTVEDLDYLESAMINLEIEIASINSQIYSFNESVQHPTVNIYLRETSAAPIIFTQTFGERLSENFNGSFNGAINGLKEFFIFIAGSLFQILAVLIFIVALILIIRKGRKQR